MYNRYVSPDQAEIEQFWHLGGQSQSRWWQASVNPRALSPFIRASGVGRELVLGQWALIPHFAKTAKLSYQTNNVRSEELASKASFRQPWLRGQRGIIPASSFDEPCWETGRNVWWRFKRVDGNPWGLAGLWSAWTDLATGEVVESYTMLNINADNHPLMQRMGGVPPLGYDVRDRQLIINDAEAAVVRRAFNEMLTIGSPTQIAAQLTAEGVTTKAWVTKDGRTRTGARIDKQYLYKLLRNRTYLGELSHKGSWFSGAHAAIIDHGIWGQVHEVLAKDSKVRAAVTKGRSRTDALLRGLLYSPTGEKMYPTFTSKKNGRKYCYYISKGEARFGAGGKTTDSLPAAEIEGVVVAQIKTVLASPETIAAVCGVIAKKGAPIDEDVAVMALHQLNDVWDQLYPVERHRITNLMIERVDLVTGGLKVRWRELGWKQLIGEFAPKSIGAELVELES
ncbi:SOS response-associated peptidase family protein [Alcaligenaceae bacterium CGII-47]|nr:SOS response-associated peptidase family protein [Alcaligenaceae bacterium CGII-47]